MRIRVLLAVLLASAAGGALARSAPEPTFHGDVDKILRRHCDTCHREGDVGPMPLDDPSVAHDWAAEMVEEIEAGRMPPWRPTRGIGRFYGERGVSPRELEVLRLWRDAGAPLGSPPRDAEPFAAPGAFELGEPDGVLDYGEAFTVPAGGDDLYRCFPVKNPFGRDVWISAMDVEPGARSVVHHVVLYLDTAGSSAAKDEADDGPGYTCFGGPATSQPMVLGGWAPGNRPRRFPGGAAIRLGRSDTVVVQLHYHNHEESAVSDRTKVGLYLADDPNPTPMFLVPVLNDTFTIPAGDPAYPVETILDPDELTGGFISVTGHVLAVLPHMHLLGRRISVDLLLPDGTEQRLVEIPDWDFNWQATYTLREAAPVPKGTRIRLHAVYDNSAENPRNPHVPPIPVSWGERTSDEMCLAFLAVTLGPARATAPPSVASVTVDARGRLVVAARRLGRGGRVEIDGVSVADSASVAVNRLRSAAAWTSLAPAGSDASVRVRRADGRLSAPFVFRR